MPTWDYVIAYGIGWLESECYPHPAFRHGNRLPTTGDLKWALAATGIQPDGRLVIDDTFNWNEASW